ncbi:MAG: 2-oxo acid dehydrogenase subunit E2, partial [Pseudomonadales bacterium]|nr:2-oxo acid dehydrogenase subunit E2 [Pseudomonadales bacterium]
TGDRVLASPAARRLAQETGVDYRRLKGSGPGGRIVEADVLAASPAQAPSQEIKASPAARRAAREMNVELARVKGSGPGGRVVKEDVEAFAAAPAAGDADRVALSGMRRTIARRMHESLQNTAQLSMDMEVIMDDAVKMRTQLIDEWQSENIRPTYTDLVIRAVTKALSEHPEMNSEFRETEILFHPEIHVGIAVSLADGLVVPVMRNANNLSLKEVCAESARLAAAARDGSLGLDDFAGGTFTVTALGMYGVDSFTPILNEPQAGILGVNRIFDGIAWQEDRPVPSKRMNLSLTWDHRVLDGVPAARFLGTVRDLLEAPYRLLV